MVEGIQEKVCQEVGIIEGVYINILQDNFTFKKVTLKAKDEHALYFTSNQTQEDIKLIVDREQLEVWHKKVEDTDWQFIDEIA